MTGNTPLSNQAFAAICALLVSSIMVLSAVGPAQASASEPAFAAATTHEAPTRLAAYLA